MAHEALGLLQQGVKTGISGALLQGEKIFGVQDPNQLKMESTLGELRADFMKAISGAAVSKSEVKRLSTFLPSITDQETVIESKLNTLISETQRTKSTLLSTLGASDQGSAPDIRAQVTAAGYDYDAMRADGLTDVHKGFSGPLNCYGSSQIQTRSTSKGCSIRSSIYPSTRSRLLSLIIEGFCRRRPTL